MNDSRSFIIGAIPAIAFLLVGFAALVVKNRSPFGKIVVMEVKLCLAARAHFPMARFVIAPIRSVIMTKLRKYYIFYLFFKSRVFEFRGMPSKAVLFAFGSRNNGIGSGS